MKLVPTGTVARLWRVDPSRVRQILRALDALPEGTVTTPGGHYRVPLDWARAFHEERKREKRKDRENRERAA